MTMDCFLHKTVVYLDGIVSPRVRYPKYASNICASQRADSLYRWSIVRYADDVNMDRTVADLNVDRTQCSCRL